MSWIKLYRDVLDSQVFAHPTTFKIWCWLLIKANHKQKFISMQVGRGFTEISVERGQFIFGRHKAESALDIDGSTIYKHIQKLQDWGNIKIESNSQYSIITICKYDEYQTNDGEEEQPSNNQVTAEEQPSNSGVTQTRIPKNDKNDKNIYVDFVSLFKQITGKNVRGDGKSERQFKARTKEGYTLKDFETAIINCFSDPYHQQNPKYLTCEFIARADKLQMYLLAKPEQKEIKIVTHKDIYGEV